LPDVYFQIAALSRFFPSFLVVSADIALITELSASSGQKKRIKEIAILRLKRFLKNFRI
jgi:hypothetical protein